MTNQESTGCERCGTEDTGRFDGTSPECRDCRDQRPVTDWRPVHVETIGDVRSFFDRLLAEGVNFHPDNSAFDVVEHATGRTTYNSTEALNLDNTMHECSTVAEALGFDVYEVALEAFEANLAMTRSSMVTRARFERDDQLQKGE